MRGTRSVLALLVPVVLLLLPASASAHAVLQESTPERGALLEEPPGSIEFVFNEPVENSFGAIRVFDSDGEAVETSEATHPGGDQTAIRVDVAERLPEGAYTVVYRVVSADAHPISGGLTFAVGSAQGGGTPVSELIGEESGARPDSPAFVVDRWLGYLAMALVVGGVLFLVVVWRPVLARRREFAAASAPLEARMRSLLRVAAVLGLLAALTSLPIQAAIAAGVPLLDGFDAALVGEVLYTRYGTVALLRVIAWAAIACYVLFAPASTWSRSWSVVGATTIPTALLVVAPALAGHASTQGTPGVLITASIAHVAAMSIWLGGLLVLLLAVPRGTGAVPPEARPALLAELLGWFSPIALWSVVALLVGGIAQAVIEVGSFAALFDDGFGRAVLVKSAILVLLIGLGWHNRSRLIPAIASIAARHGTAARSLGALGRRLRANLRAEVALIGLALVVGALLVGSSPPTAKTSGPISGSATLTEIDDALLEYTIDPAIRGPNVVHLYLFDGRDGSPLEVREATASIELPAKEIGPLGLDVRRAGPGHYTAPNTDFSIAGDWELEVRMRVSKFDAGEATIEVPID